jgi:RHS repeat-associated protein
VLLGATFRNAGRPELRTVTTSCAGVQVCTGGSITRQYGYNDNAQMNSLRVTSSGGAMAGSIANYEANGLQIQNVKILGLSGGAHYNVYGYDDRSRLQGAVLNTPDQNAAPGGSAPGTVGMNYTNPDGNADFLGGITRVPRLDAATRSALTAQGVNVDKIDPSGTTATPTTTGGHKIATFGPIGGTARTFGYAGSLVSDDGKYAFTWNEKEQLVAVTRKPATTAFPIRRIRYYYDGRGRVVGRRAQSANVVSLSDNLDTLQWQTETNPSILASDGLPADTTFAWDMVSDQLIAVFNTNPQPSDPNTGLMRQIIHGGLTYDDPIEVTMLAGDLSGKLNRLYPVFDEAAAGSLQAVLNADAQLVARNLPDDPAGAEDVSFAGATIDRASIHATKDSSGNLQSIDVTLHATEPLDPSTLAAGLRLASVNTNGVAVKTFAGTAQAVSGDAYSAKFTLSPTDWSTLNDPAAQALSIGVTPTLRAQGWASGLPILPPTEWARLNGIFTSPALPVEIRDSLSSISTFVAAIGNSSQNTTTIYNVPSIALVGSTGTGADATSALLTAKFQALPFSDPATGLVYARARWYSPDTGTFLSGDPMGYADSSNLYSFAGGDPVNGRDPSGLLCETSNASGVWSWLQRCSQDALSVQQEFNHGVFSLKTPGRAVAGVVGTAKMIGKTVAGVGAMVIDQQLAQSGDVNAMTRQGQRVMAIANAVRHPIDTVVDAHTRAADAILTAEQSGHWFRASVEAGEVGAADAAAVIGAAETGVGLARVGNNLLGRSAIAASAQEAAFVVTSEGVVRNVAAVDATIIAAPEGLTVTRFASNPFRAGIRGLGQRGGSFATTVEEANQLGGIRVGPYRVLVRSGQAIDRFALPLANRPRFGLLFGRDIAIPAGQPIGVGIVQPLDGAFGGAPELFFPWGK